MTAREPDASRRYIYGHSLGGAVAIDLAANLPGVAAGAKGLIVESSFTSLSEVVSEMGYGWVPAHMLLTQKFDSIEKIRQVRMPVLIVHGAGDRYVPPRLSEALYAAAPPPKKLLLIPNGTHNNSAWTGDAEYRLAMRELFGPSGLGSTDPRESDVVLRPCGRDDAGQPGAGPQRSGVDGHAKNRPNSPRIGGSN